MGKVKNWLMGMEEDASYMSLDEWTDKHGEWNKMVYESIKGEQMSNAHDGLSIMTTEDLLRKEVCDLQEQLNLAHRQLVLLFEEVEVRDIGAHRNHVGFHAGPSTAEPLDRARQLADALMVIKKGVSI